MWKIRSPRKGKSPPSGNFNIPAGRSYSHQSTTVHQLTDWHQGISMESCMYLNKNHWPLPTHYKCSVLATTGNTRLTVMISPMKHQRLPSPRTNSSFLLSSYRYYSMYSPHVLLLEYSGTCISDLHICRIHSSATKVDSLLHGLLADQDSCKWCALAHLARSPSKMPSNNHPLP